MCVEMRVHVCGDESECVEMRVHVCGDESECVESSGV